MAVGKFGPYRQLMRLHFARLATPYILAETIEYLTMEKRIDLPFRTFAPFRFLVPDLLSICRARDLAVCRSIPIHRALIILLSEHYLLSVGLTNHRTYAGFGLPLERRCFLRGG
jgi:hypothetical protein